MKRLLIVSRQSFGNLVDIYKWCENLPDDYLIDVVTLDGKQKSRLDKANVKVHYVSSKGNRIIRGIRYIIVSLCHMLFFKGNIIVEYFSGCDIFKKMLPWKRMILDIRTLSIKKDERLRIVENNKIKQTCDKFDYVTIISEGTRDSISLEKHKSAILPLGADVVSTANKDYNALKLLYVGTLSGRDIDKTVKGVYKFIKKHPNTAIHYDIIGDGFSGELDNLKSFVKEHQIEKYITLHGYKPHSELAPYLEKCNIGISFVPMKKCYEHQPPTKTYEYILSGLYTIATGTYCNKEIITSENGIIINDNEDEFCSALEEIQTNKDKFSSEIIRNTLSEFTWKNIVVKYLLPCLNK